MKKLLLPILALAAALAAPVARGEVRSPLEMAAALETRMVAGDGVTLPDPATEIARNTGTIDLARGDWPAAFHARTGGAICVAVSPLTGNYEFFDETGECFFTLVPAFPTTENWVAHFRHAEEGTFPDDDLYAPWRLVDVWFLTHAEFAKSAEFLSHAEFAESAEFSGRARSPSAPNLEPANLRTCELIPTNLCLTSFAFTETNLYFTAAWPTNETLPDSVLDLYGSTNLLDPRWLFLSSHPATTNPLSFAVERADLPWYVEPTQHVHDATCVSVTNIVLSPLDGTTVYTNAFWSCSTNRTPADCGFFRLGTHHDTDSDGFYDAAEILVHGTRPDRLDSDGDGVPDGIEPSIWWSNSIWATNYTDVDFSVDLVAPIDGSAETVLSIDGLQIPLSPAAGPWSFSLPPGQVVSCSSTTTGSFYILWAGTSGGSFWNEPDTFERPFWTSGNIAGYHTGNAYSQIAVPVLTVEPDFGGGLRSGGSANGNHVGQDGSVCVHAADGIQRYAWSVAPAVAAAGRTPFATGAVQLESGNPFIDVSGTSGIPLSGTFGFGPGTTNGATGTLWGSLTNVLSAHRCDATLTSPCCSVCGEYETFDGYILSIALEVSKTLLTLKHDNQTTISISRSGPWGENPPEGTIEIRRSGAANEWLTLGAESDLAPWTARIAGHFDLRGIVPCGGFALTTAVEQIEVQFPSYEDIIGDAIVFSSMSNAWRRTKDDCTEVPNQRHELGFWIQLDTFENEYSIGSLEVGDYVTGSTNGFLRPLSKPLDLPTICMPTDWGAVYTVGRFHTHTPRTYISPTNIFRRVGPSDRDRERHAVYGVPGIVYDYVGVPDPLNNPTNRLYNGHNKEDPARTYPVDPSRRQTPQ